MAKTIKIGKIELDVADGSSPHVPKNSGKFIEHGEILKTLAIGVSNNLPIILMGESGSGKTSAIRYLAEQTQNGLRRVNLNGGTTADELIGRLLMNDKGTYWVDGVLTEAMRRGEWIVLDEINAALPEVLFVLQPIMDDDGFLVLNEKDDKEIVRKHPNFRLFATCNPPEYAGTKEMNKALLSRFAICINAEFPPADKELEIIENHLGNAIAQSQMAIKLVGMANETRQSKEAGNADYAINTRDILNTLRLAEFMEPIEALALAFSNKLDSIDNKAIRTTAKLHLPSNKTKNAQRVKINQPAEIIIGRRYILDADLRGAYFGLTDQPQTVDVWKNGDLGTIIQSAEKEDSIKGDEFMVDMTYYEKENTASDKEIADAGAKVASIITFTAGQSKGKSTILVHHPELGDSMKIIEQIYEIS